MIHELLTLIRAFWLLLLEGFFLSYPIWIVTLIALIPELILDVRKYDKKERQDKIGQMWWRIVCLGFALIAVARPFQSSMVAYILYGFGIILQSCSLYWFALDTFMAKYMKKKWSYTGTTSSVDNSLQGNTHLYLKLGVFLVGYILTCLYLIRLS